MSVSDEQYCWYCNSHVKDCQCKRYLHGDTSGVCYSCLNGDHKNCGNENCTCKKKEHKSWWWKTQKEIDALESTSPTLLIKALKEIQEHIKAIADKETDDFNKGVHHSRIGDIHNCIETIKSYSESIQQGEGKEQEEHDNFAIGFAIWSIYDPQAIAYREAKCTGYELLNKYKSRPYIDNDLSKQ